MRHASIALFAAGLLAAGVTFAQAAPATKGPHGAWVDAKGMTLYTFDKDTANSGKSACSGQCATNWPPLVVTSMPPAPAGATGTVATITRDDGTMQVTYNGMPLYRFAADKAPGDTKGDGVGGIWHLAKP